MRWPPWRSWPPSSTGAKSGRRPNRGLAAFQRASAPMSRPPSRAAQSRRGPTLGQCYHRIPGALVNATHEASNVSHPSQVSHMRWRLGYLGALTPVLGKRAPRPWHLALLGYLAWSSWSPWSSCAGPGQTRPSPLASLLPVGLLDWPPCSPRPSSGRRRPPQHSPPAPAWPAVCSPTPARLGPADRSTPASQALSSTPPIKCPKRHICHNCHQYVGPLGPLGLLARQPSTGATFGRGPTPIRLAFLLPVGLLAHPLAILLYRLAAFHLSHTSVTSPPTNTAPELPQPSTVSQVSYQS